MPTSHYELVTRWTLPATVDAVWAELMHPEDWPQWWRGVKAVAVLRRGDADDIGAYRRMTWRSALPYELSFNMRTIRIEPKRLIEGIADGELSGRGTWTLTGNGPQTDVHYDWRVDATKAWMRTLAPVARPLFEWNHGVVMEWGRQGLLRRLAAQNRQTARA